MVATLSTIFLLFAQEAANPAYPWYNYPGFEAWKFINLFLFVGALILILRRPIGQTMQARRAAIRKELMRAQEERNAALAKLEEVNARLARLDTEVAALRTQSEQEAAQERERIARTTEDEAMGERSRSGAAAGAGSVERIGSAARSGAHAFAAAGGVSDPVAAR